MCLHSSPSEATAPQGFWRPGDNVDAIQGTGKEFWRLDVYKIIEKRIEELNGELRELNLDIHGTPANSYTLTISN